MQLQIINDGNLFKISSVYCMKTIFSYLDYNHLLKVVRYNKELQNKLDLNLENYKSESNYCYLKRKTRRRNRMPKSSLPHSYLLFSYQPYIAVILLLPFLLYTFLLFVAINLYGEFEIKKNYDNRLFNIIKNINF